MEIKVYEVYRATDMTKKQKEEFKQKLKDSTRELNYEPPKRDSSKLDLYI